MSNEERDRYYEIRDKLEQEQVLNEMKKVDRELNRIIKKYRRLSSLEKQRIDAPLGQLLLHTQLRILALKEKPMIEGQIVVDEK
jgi:hypothetical protein